MSDDIYKKTLMDHYRHPRNRGDLNEADQVSRGRNPQCGDDIEVGINYQGETLSQVRFRGRACSVCIASASMMTENVTGVTRQNAKVLCKSMKEWISSESSLPPAKSLAALAAIKVNQARHRCVLLSWEALSNALDE